MKKLFLILLLLSMWNVHAQLTNNTVRKALTLDANGYTVSNPILFSNQVSMLIAPTSQYQVVNFSTYTNTPLSYLTSGKLSIALGGTGTNTTLLTGTWTNAINHRVNGTNDANAYMIKGILGFNGSITNLGPGTGSSNVMVYSTGILTNKFTIP